MEELRANQGAAAPHKFASIIDGHCGTTRGHKSRADAARVRSSATLKIDKKSRRSSGFPVDSKPVTHALRTHNLGTFRLGDRLGLGGMAEVFAGEHDRLGRVAVKRILPGLAEDPEFSDMFWDEARITSRLDHPNIVRVLDYGRTDGQLYMALEFVDGPALSKVLRKAAKMKHPLSYPALLTVMVQVLDALHYVHNAADERERPLHIVHRDVSPGNIMLTKSGQAKLGDFGIVRSQALVRRTQPGELKGKVGYMSPEQAMGDAVNRQSDIFSVGIILAEFLTLRPLFLGKNELQTLTRTATVDLSTWHRYNEEVPVALRSIVERALSRDLTERYKTAAEMREALLEFARSRGWVLDPALVVDELCQLEFVERETDRSGERRIVSRIPRRLFLGDQADQQEEAPLIDAVGQPRRPQGKPVWNVEFAQATLPGQLFLALRRARTGAIELSDDGSLLVLELKDGVIVATHDSTGGSVLGTLLVEESLIGSADLVLAIGESRRQGLRLGQYLVLHGVLRESVLARVLKKQLDNRLRPWLCKPRGKLAVYARDASGGMGETPPAPSSFGQVVAAMRPAWSEADLERILHGVLDAIVLPTHNSSVVEFGLTDPEVRALNTVMVGGAYEGHSIRRVVDSVSQERVARRRDALFGLLVGLSAGLVQAPGFGR